MNDTKEPAPFDEASPGGICHLGHDWRNTTAGVSCIRCGERASQLVQTVVAASRRPVKP
jgi:hypothetical protein